MEITKRDLEALSDVRLQEAVRLYKARKYSGAYYLAGYAVECALKACLAKKARRYAFPPKPKIVRDHYYTHDLQKIAGESGLLPELERRHPKLATYWATVKDWTGESRYDSRAGKRAKDILIAIEDPADGVLQCIKRHW